MAFALHFFVNLILLPINDPIAVGTCDKGVPPNELIILLRGNSHVASKADPTDNRANGKTIFSFPKEGIFFEKVLVNPPTELLPILFKTVKFEVKVFHLLAYKCSVLF